MKIFCLMKCKTDENWNKERVRETWESAEVDDWFFLFDSFFYIITTQKMKIWKPRKHVFILISFYVSSKFHIYFCSCQIANQHLLFIFIYFFSFFVVSRDFTVFSFQFLVKSDCWCCFFKIFFFFVHKNKKKDLLLTFSFSKQHRLIWVVVKEILWQNLELLFFISCFICVIDHMLLNCTGIFKRSL